MSEKRVALITGGAGGLGKAIAEALAGDGLAVIIGDVDVEAAQETCQHINASGGTATVLELDVGQPESIARAFQHIDQQFGRCDILVNNAGIGRGGLFLDFELSDWEATLQINLTGTFVCAQHAGRRMRQMSWGRIVNIASIAGISASVGRAAYGPSKAAVISLTKQMAVELARHGITSNAVAPGPVDTALTRSAHSEKTRELYQREIPMGRYGTPNEIAQAVRFLVSEQSAYITGQVLAVDGGFVSSGLLER